MAQVCVVSDSQAIGVQVLINYINHVLESYGETVDIEQPSRQRQGNDADVAQLLDELQAGKVAALFVAGTDLTHNLPNRDEVAEAIAKVPLVISFAERVDDFASLAHFVCPDHHPLESWLDAEPVSGLLSLSQPTIQPLGQTRSILESLHQWMGQPTTAYDAIKSYWRNVVLTRAKTLMLFQAFWDRAVHDGFVEVNFEKAETTDFQFANVSIPNEPSLSEDSTRRLCRIALLKSWIDRQSSCTQPVAARVARPGH